MKPPVPFGQYVPGNSGIHRLEARAKMGVAAAFTAMLFAVEGFAGLGVSAVITVAAVVLSGVPPRLVLRGVRVVSFILFFTLLAHALRWDSATVALVRVGPLSVDADGLLTGMFFATRIVLLVVGTSLVALTTSPVRLTEGLERLMRPLERVGLPAGDIAMMLTVALRFIPTTAEEAEKVVVAQMARGARFDRGGPISRAKAYVPVLVPLFVGLFRRADELATAMESRCYRGGTGRTRLTERRMGASDWTVLAASVALMVMLGVTL
ncbi:MAG: energy-coupling factor transporter transmembrane protein EcfT [Clostridiales bacterium]|nr:energy-coupling factor transporter transmembrane protein EcfT [Clostridiales bacterium]